MGTDDGPIDVDSLSALTRAEVTELVFNLFKFRIGSITRIALAMDPESMDILEK